MSPDTSTPETIGDGRNTLSLFREAPSHEGRRTAALGRFRIDDEAAGLALVKDALARLRGEGFEAVLAPMDGDTWHSYRAVTETDGSPAFFLESPAPVAIGLLLGRAGFSPVASYVSARVGLPAPDEAPPVEGVRVSLWDGTNPERLLDAAFRLSSEAFARNPFFRPIAKEAFMALYRPLIGLMDRDFVLLAEEGDEIVGFLFGMPDWAEGKKPSAVILKTYASFRPGVGRLLAQAFHQRAAARGFSSAIHALMHDNNASRAASGRYGGREFRRYALFARSLP